MTGPHDTRRVDEAALTAAVQMLVEGAGPPDLRARVERSIRGGGGADRAGVFGRWREVGAAAAAALLILATLGWWFGHRRGDAARPVGIAETSPVVPGPSAGQPAPESKAQTTA